MVRQSTEPVWFSTVSSVTLKTYAFAAVGTVQAVDAVMGIVRVDAAASNGGPKEPVSEPAYEGRIHEATWGEGNERQPGRRARSNEALQANCVLHPKGPGLLQENRMHPGSLDGLVDACGHVVTHPPAARCRLPIGTEQRDASCRSSIALSVGHLDCNDVPCRAARSKFTKGYRSTATRRQSA